NQLQTVNPGESIVFTEAPVPCNRGLVRHRDDTGAFLLRGVVPYSGGCRCQQSQSAIYLVDFGANIAVPTGETVGAISVAVTLDGTTIPASTMTATPAAVEEFFNVSRAVNAQVWKGCCQTLAIRNVSAIPILVQNANVIFSRPDLAVTR
ncbi:MAG: hypothetical protein IJ849_05990, partial [Selenomonadaceae bacterium]|nr:hypothetical protein [Selenomonadaceae bacterium]